MKQFRVRSIDGAYWVGVGWSSAPDAFRVTYPEAEAERIVGRILAAGGSASMEEVK